MTVLILACLMALLLVTFALSVGLELSWPVVAITDLMLAALLVAALFYFWRAELAAWRGRLVDDLRAIWKRWSIQIVAAQGVVVGVWAGLSTVGLTPTVPEWAKAAVVLTFTLAALTAAGFKQKNLPPPGGDV